MTDRRGLTKLRVRAGHAVRRARKRGAGHAALASAGGPGLVVATYNVHACVGVDRRYDPVRVGNVLAELDADIIGLQEVGSHRGGPPIAHQGAYLAERLGMTIVLGAPSSDHRRRFGNALLTRLPVRAVRHIDLSVDGCEPRGAIDVDLAFGERTLRVIATHFGLRGGERRVQTQRLLSAMNGYGEAADAVLVLGDLNEWRGRQGGIRVLDRELGRAPSPRTFPSWCPILRLDRIYAAHPALLSEFGVHRSALARLASDHLPLRARLAWSAAD